jgi:hypothetical protein
MIFIRRKPFGGRAVRAVTYGVVIITLAGLAVWAYHKHRATRGRVEVTPPVAEAPPALAGLEPRLAYASEQELLAPAAFPWSLAAVSRLPRAEVGAITVLRRPEGPPPAEDLPAALAATLAEQTPTVARPFTLAASPPYLITPVVLRLEFELDDAGAAAAAGVAGAPAELNAAFAERAVHFVFPQAAAGVAFAATVTLVPYPYDRLAARRGGKAVTEEEYRLLFRALQFNSFPLYDTCLAAAPELLTAREDTVVSFDVGADGRPRAASFEPPLPSAEAREALADALAEIYLPKTFAGARVEFVIGG